MRRSFKFRLRPTTKQAGSLAAMLADHCELYNAALQERRDAFLKRSVTVTYAMQSEQLKEIRQLVPDQERWSFCSQQATLRRLNRAFSAFFRRVHKGQKQVAKIHRIIARRRRDFHHKTAVGVVRRFDLIAYEKLNIIGMVRAPRPKPCPDRPGVFLPNGSKAKAGLNRRILDAAWAQFLAILVAKAENAGRLVVAVNARLSSQTCSVCMHVDAASRMGSKFRCTKCGHFDHADVNAARNHLRAGLALIQPDGSRSP